MRSRLALLLGCLLLIAATGLATGGVAAAAAPLGDDAPVTTLGQAPEGGGIIPRPGSGTEPEDAGDRGGALQTVLFVAIIGGIVVIGALVVRESRRARAERGF